MSEKSEITTNRENEKKELQRSLLLSGVVHVLLFIGLFTVFQWQTQSETVYAELWAPEDISSGNDPNGVAKKNLTLRLVLKTIHRKLRRLLPLRLNSKKP